MEHRDGPVVGPRLTPETGAADRDADNAMLNESPDAAGSLWTPARRTTRLTLGVSAASEVRARGVNKPGRDSAARTGAVDDEPPMLCHAVPTLRGDTQSVTFGLRRYLHKARSRLVSQRPGACVRRAHRRATRRSGLLTARPTLGAMN